MPPFARIDSQIRAHQMNHANHLGVREMNPLFSQSRFVALLRIANCIAIQPQFGRFKRKSDANKNCESQFSRESSNAMKTFKEGSSCESSRANRFWLRTDVASSCRFIAPTREGQF